MAVPDGFGEMFGSVGVRGHVHVRCLHCVAEFGHHADEPVVLASVVKVPLVLEFARQVAAGQLDPADRVRVRAADRLGGTGTAGCTDDVELSLRDAALFALSISDNSAADALFDRVGVDNVRSLLRELGLTGTQLVGPPRELLRTMAEDVGAANSDAFAQRFRSRTPRQVRGMRFLDPSTTNAAPPHDMTRLLQLVWHDRAGPVQVCATVRRLLGQQVSTARLASGFPPGTRVYGKSGTLACVRNEIGVVDYPGLRGRRYAVGVFTVAEDLETHRPDVDQVIGAAARAAAEAVVHTACCDAKRTHPTDRLTPGPR